MPRMSFGKYKGRDINDIPLSYLRWLIENVDILGPRVRETIKARLGEQPRSTSPPPPPPSPSGFDQVIRAWHRLMTKKYHPDRGGHHEAMVAVNDGAELFRDLAKQIGGTR